LNQLSSNLKAIGRPGYRERVYGHIAFINEEVYTASTKSHTISGKEEICYY